MKSKKIRFLLIPVCVLTAVILTNQNQAQEADTIDVSLFEKFVLTLKNFDADIMLEIKDKEKSALKAFEIIKTYSNQY